MSVTARPRPRTSEAALLDAAYKEFVAVGVRRCTMEGIARTAGISRASLYLRYSSKDEIFRAVVIRVWDNVLADAERAWDLHDTFAARLTHVVNAKLDMWIEICASFHGTEIVDSEDAIAGDITRRERERYIDLIRRLIDTALGEGEYEIAAVGVSSRTVADIIVAWVEATKLRPGNARARHRYVNDAVRFFTAQAGLPDHGKHSPG
jgi:AcrR family transcriptional regulator